jgi:hypothetical protein
LPGKDFNGGSSPYAGFVNDLRASATSFSQQQLRKAKPQEHIYVLKCNFVIKNKSLTSGVIVTNLVIYSNLFTVKCLGDVLSSWYLKKKTAEYVKYYGVILTI